MIQPQLEQKVFDMEREIRSLTQRLDKLEKLISGDASTEVRVTCGDASIRLLRNGDVQVRGGQIEITAARNAQIKSNGDLVLKGSKILQN
ncbi:MAG TPA: hypothetical protein VH157_08730 [Bryobacteraceae bacterium]|jgi:hypothetical protein|nr:hypothetical protein [Bryobacteraceae bacterium]